MEVFIAIISLVVGVCIGLSARRQHPVGDLRIDRSDPLDAPYLFLELDTDVYTIMRKKYVTFRVKIENFIPHE